MCTAPADCAVIGDTDAHMEAARRAGAHGILVSTVRPQATTAHTAPDLGTAVRALLSGRPVFRMSR
ncbi:HAD hydrolase-like protein [Streptomyces spinoverrucosus]|uniref:HAD hydrolase-like protein n=1 Tax=Streptomyces spinoverrucosus TaxID=284043 RepID=UPI00280A858A|nr:HAD hydrolase-like protein [Streptomyces spinoverrucosus]